MNKVIHYCWFGRKELPEYAKFCITSWKKYMPDYQVIEWNENNFDIDCYKYVQDAYKDGNYAVVSDVCRLLAIYNYGGIYFDTNVELIKPLDCLLEQDDNIMGLHKANHFSNRGIEVNPGLIIYCKEPHNEDIYNLINLLCGLDYHNSFNSKDIFTTFQGIVQLATYYFNIEKKDIKQKQKTFTLYPSEYFAPICYTENVPTITDNTYSVHGFCGNWGRYLSWREDIRNKQSFQ